MKKFCKNASLFLGWFGAVSGLFSVWNMFEFPQWVLPVGMLVLGVLYLCGRLGIEFGED